MEHAHQRIHQGHPVRRQRMLRGRAQHVLRACAEEARNDCHDSEGRRRREAELFGCAASGRCFGRNLHDIYARTVILRLRDSCDRARAFSILEMAGRPDDTILL